MTFNEWWEAYNPDAALDYRARNIACVGWNAALEQAALLVEEHTDAVHTPGRIRDLKESAE
jgi:hypothetical protein